MKVFRLASLEKLPLLDFIIVACSTLQLITNAPFV